MFLGRPETVSGPESRGGVGHIGHVGEVEAHDDGDRQDGCITATCTTHCAEDFVRMGPQR
jgi:hypothetical protein